MRVAVVGSGVAGLAAAWTLVKGGHTVVVYERDSHVGGHAWTQNVEGIPVDVGFMVFNQVTYPHLLAWFDDAGVPIETSDMSFAVSLDGGRGCEWGSNGLSALFCQPTNALRPSFWRMLREMVTFQGDVLRYLRKVDAGDATEWTETLGAFLDRHGYGSTFRTCYLVPVCAAIWSCSSTSVLGCSAVSILSFLRNHHMLQVLNRPKWLTVKGRSATYVAKIVDALAAAGSQVRTNCAVTAIRSQEGGTAVTVVDEQGGAEQFAACVVAVHAPDALLLLGDGATREQREVLGAFQYSTSDLYLHRDASLMPRHRSSWSAWNFLGDVEDRLCVTYWLNKLQNLGPTGGLPVLVTLNPPRRPERIVSSWTTSHPIPSPAAAAASGRIHNIQGTNRLWFCGAYLGFGFHEDGFKAGLAAAHSLLRLPFTPLPLNPYFVPTWTDTFARTIVISFLKDFVRIGHLEFHEAGGSILSFGEPFSSLKPPSSQYGPLVSRVRILRPSFYTKVAFRADLGLADAFIDGDFSSPDDVMSLLRLLIVNRDRARRPGQRQKERRGWWSPAMLTAAVGYAASYGQHLLRANTLTNARRNIAAHYDLSNELFAAFLDETMTYSCAIFAHPEEPLKDAQLQKLHTLIKKARVTSAHRVLEIGFGWGSLSMELVRLTGCHVTGITLSEQQLELATERVREAGLGDRIEFRLCDYRTMAGDGEFDRILSCEMLEAVGHEYYGDFFRHCDRLLAPDGVLVVQVITTPEERYEYYRRSPDFIKEYIFPGCCCPSLSALTAAMSASSTLSVEEVVNIGPHYATTLLRWRTTFSEKKDDIRRMGFDDKFLRTWDYYFAYCAIGFQTRTIGNLQIVFSRPGNVAALTVPPIES